MHNSHPLLYGNVSMANSNLPGCRPLPDFPGKAEGCKHLGTYSIAAKGHEWFRSLDQGSPRCVMKTAGVYRG